MDDKLIDLSKGCVRVKVLNGPACGKPIVNKTHGLCNGCYATMRARKKRAEAQAAKETIQIPKDLGEKVAQAKTPDDWKVIAASVSTVMQGILDGTTKASAAQVSLLKEIMNRAYGRPVATQEDKKTSTGIVILPTLDTAEKGTVCPRCGFDVLNKAEADMTRKLAVKALYNVTE